MYKNIGKKIFRFSREKFTSANHHVFVHTPLVVCTKGEQFLTSVSKLGTGTVANTRHV